MGITDWIVVDHLADALSRNKSLLTLDLSTNKIGQDGGIYLAKALEQNKTLTELKLSHCSIQEAGAKGMMKMLGKNQFLKRYALSVKLSCDDKAVSLNKLNLTHQPF